MNNNVNNNNQNQNGYPSNNNWSSQNYSNYGNNFDPNFRFNNNFPNGKSVAKTCKNLSIAYLSIILFAIITLILTIVFCAMSFTSSYVASSEPYYNDPNNPYYDEPFYGSDNTTIVTSFFGAFIAMIVITVILAIALEAIAIVLIVKTNSLKNYYPNTTEALWILFLIGLFIGITGIVGACMTISTCHKIEKGNWNSYATSGLRY